MAPPRTAQMLVLQDSIIILKWEFENGQWGNEVAPIFQPILGTAVVARTIQTTLKLQVVQGIQSGR